MASSHSRQLHSLLKHDLNLPTPKDAEREIRELQLEMLRIQEGLFHARQRAILVFEGFDASGKGGVIRRLSENIDPRGIAVHPIGPPEHDEQERHWLYRFWTRLPRPGVMAVFDRSWYGRVLVERVEGLTPRKSWKRAFDEINQFEAMLVNDGIEIVKVFLAISKEEQLKRFEDRLKDPYKHWKLTSADLAARAKWNDYVEAVDEMLDKTHTKHARWNLIPADNKDFARIESIRITCHTLHRHRKWMEREVAQMEKRSLKAEMMALKREDQALHKKKHGK
jgi:AMP-polyphosphate phosphotransferase